MLQLQKIVVTKKILVTNFFSSQNIFSHKFVLVTIFFQSLTHSLTHSLDTLKVTFSQTYPDGRTDPPTDRPTKTELLELLRAAKKCSKIFFAMPPHLQKFYSHLKYHFFCSLNLTALFLSVGPFIQPTSSNLRVKL